MARKRSTPLAPPAVHLADRVYVLRHTKRMTQAELAAAVGCSPATISGLERKKIGDITLEHLVALARVLDTTTDDLLGLAATPTANEPEPACTLAHADA